MATISDYVQDINKRIFLPGLQREFVWSKKQTANLFDSLIREYPVGMITRWDVAHSNADYYPYEFIQNFVDDKRSVPDVVNEANYQKYNDEVDESDSEAVMSFLVIDGQQRLTSLFIGLFGQRISYTRGRAGSRSNLDDWSAYELCINLFGHPDYDGGNLAGDWEFEFRKTGEYDGNNETGYTKSVDGTHRFWFPLPRMMNDNREVRNMSELNSEINDEIGDIEVNQERRSKFKTIRSQVLPKIESRILDAELPEKDVKKSASEIKEIFQRINIEGESPDPYQLLLSRMMSTWPFTPPKDKQINPRRLTEKWVREFKRNHGAYEKKIGREIFMRYSSYLIESVLKTNDINNLSDEELLTLRDKWLDDREDNGFKKAECQWFRNSLERAFKSVTALGFTGSTMSTTSMIAALGKFYYNNPNAEWDDRDNLEQIYRFLSLLRLFKRSKGSLGRVEATKVSRFLEENEGEDYEVFPADEAFDYLDVEIARETIENMVHEARYGTGNTGEGQFTDWEVAAILNLSTPTFEYMNVDEIEVDHIYPESKADEIRKAAGIDEENFSIHRLGNLQLLPKNMNLEKSDTMPEKWLDDIEGEEEHYRRVNSFPDRPHPGAKNYQEFVEEREGMLIEKVFEEVQ